MRRWIPRLAWLVCAAAISAAGCGGGSPPQSDALVPVDQVPAHVMEVARRQLPGYTFKTVYKMKRDGKDAFEIRGQNKQGKTREVEVSATGEMLEIE